MTPPNLDKAYILTTGSEATEAALKMARKFTGKPEIIAFHGAFHGRTYGALSAGGMRSGSGARGFGPYLPGFVHAPMAYCYRCPFDKTYPDCHVFCLSYLDRVFEAETEGQIAAVIVEAYQGGAGSIVPPIEWMRGLEDWCRRHDALLIVDEVQSSFGRTGRMFCFEHYGITPNLLCLGKGISSSFPVSAVVGESRIMDSLPPGSMSSTHGGNAFGARMALTNIEILEEEGLVDNAARVGALMLRRFKELEESFEQVGQVRGLGLVLGLEIVRSKAGKEPDPETCAELVRRCAEAGLLLIAPIGIYGNVIRIAPPLVITEEQAEVGLEIFERVLRGLSHTRRRLVAGL
jgi:4-aminobutyrate aminotransferase-like enzyme